MNFYKANLVDVNGRQWQETFKAYDEREALDKVYRRYGLIVAVKSIGLY